MRVKKDSFVDTFCKFVVDGRLIISFIKFSVIADYSAMTENSAPPAKSAPFCELNPVKRM